MGDKRDKTLKGDVSPAVKFGTCPIKQAIKNMQLDDNKTDDKQAHNPKIERKENIFYLSRNQGQWIVN
jgi:hypothetical protein